MLLIFKANKLIKMGETFKMTELYNLWVNLQIKSSEARKKVSVRRGKIVVCTEIELNRKYFLF